MGEILTKLQQYGVLPVVVLDDAKDARGLAKALIEGGLPCAEVTFRTDAAEEAIQIISKEYPEMIVGAGTVLTIDQAKRAIDAGAKFIVSPGINEEVVKYVLSRNIPMIPGTCTPTDVDKAVTLGITDVKFFPAEVAGGVAMMKAIAAPYTNVNFIPSGGINQSNLKEYLSYNRILFCGGSWMVKKDLITNQEFDTIKELTKETVQMVKEVRG